MATITINGISIDPAKQAPALAATNLLSADASQSNFILVQTTAPLTAGERKQLADLGAEILEYVPEQTYICRYKPEDLNRLRALPFITWVNTYLHGFKVSPRLRPTAQANLLAAAAPSQSKDRVTVEVVLHKDSMSDAVRNRIAAAAGVDPSQAMLFIQSQVPEHAELHLLLSMMAPLGWLERVPTYKDQQEKLADKDLATYGFLGYPLLQSADILIYRAKYVPVGEDQVPHVEFTREVARRFNHLYGREPGFEEKAKAGSRP